MDGVLKFVVVLMILAVILTTGRNILVKKTQKKNRIAPVAVEAVPAKVVKTERTVSPPQEIVPETLALSLPELEEQAIKPLCESDWEKKFCQKVSASVIGLKGAKLIGKSLTIYVDNEVYLSRADIYLNAPSNDHPGLPGEVKHGDPGQDKKIPLAGALLLRELLKSFKSDLKDHDLTIVFLKNPTSPMMKSSFAFRCQDEPLQNVNLEELFSEEKLRSLDVNYSHVCQNL